MPARADMLARMAVQAASLWDRLAGGYRPLDSSGEPGELARDRLARWCNKAAGGNRDRFARRLGWLGTTIDAVTPLLGEVELAGAPPPWLVVFARARERTMYTGRAAGERAADEDTLQASAGRHPFGALLTGLVRTGLERLAPACEACMGPGARAELIDDLFAALSFIAGPTLYGELAAERSADHRWAQSPSPDSTAGYERFVARHLDGALWDLFLRYPVLARLLAEAVIMWAEHVSELADRYLADRAELEQVFSPDAPLGAMAGLRLSLSDRHDRGRTVAAVHCAGGVTLYYKPRPLGMEAAWYELLGFLQARGSELAGLRVVARATHGWIEPAVPRPCRTLAEAHAYYRRAGQLLCLQYVLDASDCFHENIVAAGDQPMLIDHETLVRGIVAAASEPTDLLAGSVLRTGFLPTWDTGPAGEHVDISGLAAVPGQPTPYRKRRWQHVNTDAITLGYEPICIDTDAHRPRLDGRLLAAADHTAEIVAGFRAMYELILGCRAELAAARGPIARLGEQPMRAILRATKLYGLLLKRLEGPAHMRSGVDRSIELDLLARLYVEPTPAQAGVALPPVLQAELAALERLDMPRITTPAGSRDLHLPTGAVIRNGFARSAVDNVRDRLAGLGPEDCELQGMLIRTALHGPGPSASVSPASAGPDDIPAGLTLSGDQAIAEAERLAAVLAASAIRLPGGGITWLAAQTAGIERRLALLRMDLYGGLAGVALFHAALARVTGGGAAREQALATLAPLRAFVRAAGPAAPQGYSLGAGTGAGSLLYALARCATLLGEPALLDEAGAVAAWLQPAWIAADDALDVLAGSAGAILGLLAYASACRSLARAKGPAGDLDQALASARLCGEHLLARQQPAARGGAAWPGKGGVCLTGMSHGAAGIALALLELGRATDEPRFAEAAALAIEFERAVFDPEAGNWPDFRPTAAGQPAYALAWCHGAPGIGMARLAGLAMLATPDIGRDIGAAVAAVTRAAPATTDSLCCGTAGRAELLVAASQKTDHGLQQHAAELLATAVQRALPARAAVPDAGSAVRDPSLFQGLAGLGYELLRLARPDEIPSVLVWE